ncbi:MAG: hypothetical protein Rpha_1138 [Candidatus Ruthia sp. Apha_13_S6]|nr:hypothetical protein [Candidatus Ruthia sp. Apha_13_S6]
MSIKAYQLISKDEASALLALVKAQDKARWVEHEMNFALNSEMGDYHALFDNCMSKELRNALISIAPNQSPLRLLIIIV